MNSGQTVEYAVQQLDNMKRTVQLLSNKAPKEYKKKLNVNRLTTIFG